MPRVNIQKIIENIFGRSERKYLELDKFINDTNVHDDDPEAFAIYTLQNKVDQLIEDVNVNRTSGEQGEPGVTGPQGDSGRDGVSTTSMFVQLSCSDTRTNINLDTTSPANINFSTTDVISNSSDFSTSSGVVTILTAGVYEVHFNIVMYSTAVRSNPYIRVSKNGSMTDITGGSYIRNASGHRRTNSQATGLLTLAVNDTISVKSKYSSAWGMTGAVTMISGTKLIIKKIG